MCSSDLTPPVDPEDEPFISSISLDTANPDVFLITVQARAGDRFEVEYSENLSEGLWSTSGGEYHVDADGPYTIQVPRDGQKTRFFRLKRIR